MQNILQNVLKIWKLITLNLKIQKYLKFNLNILKIINDLTKYG